MRIGVIFDMDGVLVASGPAHQASWRALARKHGLQITDAAFRATFGKSSRDIIRELWGAELADDAVRALDDEKETIYRDLIRGLVPLTIGVRELLAGLHGAGFMLAVATSGPAENVELVLAEGRLAALFHATVNGYDVQKGKPAPDGFLLAAERLGVPAARCIVVEDAPVGIQAARAAGMKTVGLVGTHHRQRLLEAGVDAVVDSLREISPERVSDWIGA
jgi:beta-phosphoglucomutase